MINATFKKKDFTRQVASAYKEAAVRRLVNVAVKVQTESKRMTRGHGRPSAPGTPPHIQSKTLHDSIQVVTMLKEGKVYVVAIRPSGLSGKWYAATHEEGLGNYPRRPYLRPALNRVEKNMADEFKDLDVYSTQSGRTLK